MKIIKLSPIVIAATAFALAACDSTTPSLIDDAAVTEDLASVSGDAVAISIESMLANEVDAQLQNLVASTSANDNTLIFTRARTCYNSSEAEVNCTPLNAVRRIVTTGTANGSRTGSRTGQGGVTRTYSGVVHRAFSDTLRRVFNTAQPPVETSRSHAGVGSGNDTTTFTQGELSSEVAEATLDTVKALTWNLPRSSNPWPVSGSVVRVSSVHVTVESSTRTESREFVRTIQVAFPADAQGNVVLTINNKTCNLNLVTHAVTNCQ